MKTFLETIDSLWQVLVVALLLGAGLPALFATGIRLLAVAPAADETAAVGKRSPVAAVGGVLCIGFVLVAIVSGILFVMKDFLAHSFGIHLF